MSFWDLLRGAPTPPLPPQVSPVLKLEPPGTPYGIGSNGWQNWGDQAEVNTFSSGQFNPPYNPYSQRYLAQMDLRPCEGATQAVANVVPVSLRGNGGELAGPFQATPLLDPVNGPGGLLS